MNHEQLSNNLFRIWYGQNGGTKQIKNAICGCYLKEEDGQCHWRQGKKTFDLPGLFFIYHSISDTKFIKQCN